MMLVPLYVVLVVASILCLTIKSTSSPLSSPLSSPVFGLSTAERKEWCNKMVLKYHIIPGMSFGDLETSKHAKFLSYDCDEFYCKPHELRGKGVYKCDPLDSKSNITTTKSWLAPEAIYIIFMHLLFSVGSFHTSK